MFENSRQVTTIYLVLYAGIRGPVPVFKMAEVIVSSPI
jgi:hypothetical protein